MTKRLAHVGWRLIPVLSITDDDTDTGGVTTGPVNELPVALGTLAQAENEWPEVFARMKSEFATREKQRELLAQLETKATPRVPAPRKANPKATKAVKKAAPARKRTR